ncbi:methyltransferase domain-containing protein [Streptomyces sp. BPTC-684]|uniref:class I SAM-dependent methyltransferase n=1 Tax=Streptomyces sp. BPTC-684 TaxID=3043734 RepID=UPI0032C217E0
MEAGQGGHIAAQRRFDVWAAGTAYERYMGRWSRTVAERFITWLGRADGLRWLDVGCGTGALTVATRCAPAALLGVDRSAGFAASARASATAGQGMFAVADARALPLPDTCCDVVVSGLVLNFLPLGGTGPKDRQGGGRSAVTVLSDL